MSAPVASSALPLVHMPGPKGLPFFGSVLQYTALGQFSFDRLHLAKLENYRHYGRVYKERLGPAITIIQVFDPVLAERVFRHEGRYPLRPPFPITLVASKRDNLTLGLGSLNGEEWYKIRTNVQKLMMRPHAASAYLPAQNAVADDFLHMVQRMVEESSGEIQDFSATLLKYTMESIGTVCFNTRLGVLKEELPSDSEAFSMLSSSASMFDAVQRSNFDFPWFALWRSPLYRQFLKGKLECNRIALGHIREAMGDNKVSDNNNKVATTGHCPAGPNFLSTLVHTQLDLEQVVGITTDLFTAGIDSTANALSFLIYNLARNSDKQDVLAQEILQVLPPGAEVTAESIDKMPYLKACLKESFRLNFPIEGGTTRILPKDLVLGDYLVPKGTFIAFNNQTMCLQEEYFPDPGNFLPERWLKDGSTTIRPPHPFVMLPFGYGPRMCIGRRFAEQEIYLALIKILQHYRVEYHGEPVGMLNRVFTMPDRPLKVKVIPRST